MEKYDNGLFELRFIFNSMAGPYKVIVGCTCDWIRVDSLSYYMIYGYVS